MVGFTVVVATSCQVAGPEKFQIRPADAADAAADAEAVLVEAVEAVDRRWHRSWCSLWSV
jgi:hypothetical protein